MHHFLSSEDGRLLAQTIESNRDDNAIRKRDMPALFFDADDNISTPVSIMYMRRRGLPWLTAAFGILSFVLIVALFALTMRHPNTDPCVGCFASYDNRSNESERKQNVTDVDVESKWPTPNPTSALSRFKNAVVICDNTICSEIGRGVLLRGGNAADAAVAAAICIGALNPYSSGLGGGFMMTFYKRREKRCITMNARETAPNSANPSWFNANPSDAVVGYKSIATPGELHGLWTIFKRFGSGRIAWQDLLMPTVNLLNSGYPVSAFMEQLLQYKRESILNEPTMMHAFMNPLTNDLYKEGDLLRNMELAQTLRRLAISSDPVKLFYRGDIAREVDNEMIEHGGFLKKVDLAAYESSVDESPLINENFRDSLALCGPAPPSSFAATQLIVALITKLYNSSADPSLLRTSDEFYHHFLEAEKLAFAQRASFGDVSFVPEAHLLAVNMTSPFYIEQLLQQIHEKADNSTYYDERYATIETGGSSHISIVDVDGNAISLSSSINSNFGSMRRSEKLGIIWNNHMQDFSIPEVYENHRSTLSEENRIQPRKRPLSYMSPTIIFDKSTGEVRMVIGAAGGSKIISAIAYVIARSVIFNETIKEAVDAPRLHAHLSPLYSEYEQGFPQEMISMLEQRGQIIRTMKFPYSIVYAILRDRSHYLTVSNDYRRSIHIYPAGF
uniref:Uncharacterized protein n=1 Tax=Parascaris univalens TaxID=6257 RepID=A0A915AFG4_PARUN